MADQHVMWNQKHAAGEHAEFRAGGGPFAKLVEPFLVRESKLLELGCGVGGDAYYFAEHGYQVLATDFSETVIEQDKALLKHPGLQFSILDTTQPLPFESESFDAVFAHLSLHYYDHTTTKKIIGEVERVLKQQGIFAFACKSIHDSDYGKGQKLEADFFVSPSGHLRHFFNLDYVQQLLGGTFKIKLLDEIGSNYLKNIALVRCIAEKI